MVEAIEITGRRWLPSITGPIVVMHFGTDPVTTVTLNYTELTVTVNAPRIYWSDDHVSESRPLIIEDLDPAKWMRRTRIVNGNNKHRHYEALDRLETFLSTLK